MQTRCHKSSANVKLCRTSAFAKRHDEWLLIPKMITNPWPLVLIYSLKPSYLSLRISSHSFGLKNGIKRKLRLTSNELHILTITSPSPRLLFLRVPLYLRGAAFYQFPCCLSLAVFVTLSVGHYFINL